MRKDRLAGQEIGKNVATFVKWWELTTKDGNWEKEVWTAIQPLPLPSPPKKKPFQFFGASVLMIESSTCIPVLTYF